MGGRVGVLLRHRWLTVLSVGFVLLLAGLAAGYGAVTRDLPDEAALAKYQPPLPTTLRAVDGTVFRAFARERRVYVPYNEIPPMLVRAYLSAEDKNFFTHGGVDVGGILRALFTNARNVGSDKRPQGASTITQQVAKNLLQNSEVSFARKLREALLARRIEATYTKPQILELYLNQIFLGRNAYGVEAAAQAYFGHGTTELTLPQMAYLAVLPKAPSNYNPDTHPDRALARRNWVLGQMRENGYISPAQLADAQAAPLATVAAGGITGPPDRTGDYYVEAVRRDLIARFGETPDDGANSVYGGGLWVRATIDPVLQAAADRALRDGLVKYDRGHGWRGPLGHIEPGEGWARRLALFNPGTGYDDWFGAVVLTPAGGGALRIGFADGTAASLPVDNAGIADRANGRPAWATLKAGDVILVTKAGVGGGWSLRQVPGVSGAMIVEEPQTGRILAMVGGFDARLSSFNRATQAQRQPGSTFKPFVYATALDNGMTPASIVVDAPYCVYQSRTLGRKCFRNFGGGYAGPQTMRWGLEQSRNLMTVRIAYNTGMDKVVKTADALGIGRYQPVTAIALGAGTTTPMRLVNAYATLLNQGRKTEPVLYDLVQDRTGQVIYRADARPCRGCLAGDWNGGAMPRFPEVTKQVIDARTAYQTVHMLEGVVQRGTATVLRSLDVPIMGKTGTTSGPTDVWFVGGTPKLVAGLYIGYDRPQKLGGWVQGGTVAAPIWKQWGKVALKDAEPLPFLAPAGVRMVRIDRRSGKRVFGSFPGDQWQGDPKASVIWEAFKPQSEPRRTAAVAAEGPRGRAGRVRSDAQFLESTGGIY